MLRAFEAARLDERARKCAEDRRGPTAAPIEATGQGEQATASCGSVQWNVQMAGALMAALPTLLVYVPLGRYFLRGLLAGSLEG